MNTRPRARMVLLATALLVVSTFGSSHNPIYTTHHPNECIACDVFEGQLRTSYTKTYYVQNSPDPGHGHTFDHAEYYQRTFACYTCQW